MLIHGLKGIILSGMDKLRVREKSTVSYSDKEKFPKGEELRFCCFCFFFFKALNLIATKYLPHNGIMLHSPDVC